MNTRRVSERIAGWRLTEEPGLYGLVVRERGELIEYVSYHEAARRHSLKARRAAVELEFAPQQNRTLAPA